MSVPSYRPGETTDIEDITSIHDLARVLGVEPRQDALTRHVYAQTTYGAWLALMRGGDTQQVTGVRLGSNVEGVEDAPATRSLTFPFSSADFQATLNGLEADAETIWRRTHGCWDCGPADPSTGYRAVRDDCPTCGGRGRVLQDVPIVAVGPAAGEIREAVRREVMGIVVFQGREAVQPQRNVGPAEERH